MQVRDLGVQAAPDKAVLECARADGQVLISADTDFGGLLARSRASNPSVILIRRLVGRRAAEQASIILANLDQVAEDLTAGAVVVLHEDLLVSLTKQIHPPGRGHYGTVAFGGTGGFRTNGMDSVL